MKSKELKILLSDTKNKIDTFASYFALHYFGRNDCSQYWVADDIGGVYVINDYFFNIEEMFDFVKYNYSKKQMFAYKDYVLDVQTKNYEAQEKCRLENKIIHVTCARDWIKMKVNK